MRTILYQSAKIQCFGDMPKSLLIIFIKYIVYAGFEKYLNFMQKF